MTIRALVADPALGLAVRGGSDGLDQAVSWVAVSELPDPTQWLEGAELLLTSGMWLNEAPDRDATADAWARRLHEAGARAVGFGVEPWFGAVPPEVLRAARRHRLTLVEVPPSTPFVAIDRRVADLHAAQARRHEAHIIRSQQRLARAAADDGSHAVVTTLARELQGWVVALDTSHQVSLTAGDLDAVPIDRLTEAAQEAEARASRSMLAEIDGSPVYLVPLGPHDRRRGTLCVDYRPVAVTPARFAGMVGTAAALLTVLLPTDDYGVRSVIVDLLMQGDSESARRIGDVAGIGLPATVVAVAFTGGARTRAVAGTEAAGAWRVPTPDAAVDVVLAPAEFADTRVASLLHDWDGVRVGISRAVPISELPRAVDQAASAVKLARGDRKVIRFDETSASELDAVLASAPARRLAAALLAPLDDHPDREVLLTSATAWINANARWDPAASAVGVHRETLRSRINRLASTLDLDLDSPQDRLALAMALRSRP
ncbi:MAG: PucR family transcriptional regulator ligand-binding domain-containing protein [Nocardioidaceae bacterium]